MLSAADWDHISKVPFTATVLDKNNQLLLSFGYRYQILSVQEWSHEAASTVPTTLNFT